MVSCYLDEMGLKGSAMSCVSIIVLPIPVYDYLLNIFFSN